MSQTREELIARRDALIEQLQGEWIVDVDMRSINRKAILAALISMAGASVLCLILIPLLIFVVADPKQSTDWLGVDMIIFFGAVNLFAGAVFYIYIWGHALWYRGLNPIVVDGHMLSWNKRRGFVPERLDLHGVSSVLRYDGAGAISVFLKVVKMLGRENLASYGPVKTFSSSEHNTPQFIPAMFQDGHRLVSIIEQIAELNTQLDAFDKAQSA